MDNDVEDPERNDVKRLEGMDNDFGDPERNNILRLEGMRRESGLLILITMGLLYSCLLSFVILYNPVLLRGATKGY